TWRVFGSWKLKGSDVPSVPHTSAPRSLMLASASACATPATPRHASKGTYFRMFLKLMVFSREMLFKLAARPRQLFASGPYGVEIGGETHAHVAEVAIGGAVQDGDAGGVQQVMHKIQVVPDGLAVGGTLANEALNIGKHIERPCRHGARHRFDGVEQVHDDVAALFVQGDDVGHALLVGRQRRGRRHLADLAGAGSRLRYQRRNRLGHPGGAAA